MILQTRLPRINASRGPAAGPKSRWAERTPPRPSRDTLVYLEVFETERLRLELQKSLLQMLAHAAEGNRFADEWIMAEKGLLSVALPVGEENHRVALGRRPTPSHFSRPKKTLTQWQPRSGKTPPCQS